MIAGHKPIKKKTVVWDARCPRCHTSDEIKSNGHSAKCWRCGKSWAKGKRG